jgi:hypothetical protein
MRRLGSFLAVAFLFLGATLWGAQMFTTTWEPRLRALVETRAGALLGADVHIDSLSIAFLHRIRLNHIEARERTPARPIIFRASNISLTLSLLDLPRALVHRNLAESIGLVSVDSPWIVGSPELLRHFRSRPSTPSAATPLLFTLAWEGGTFQWKDPAAPHGAWTIYKTRGAFRIRGPKVEYVMRGSLEQAETVRFSFRRLGKKRWSAQALIYHGDLRAVRALVEHLLRRPLLAEGWQTAGGFDLELEAGGRRPFSAAQPLWTYLENGRLTFSKAHLQFGPQRPPLEVRGAIKAQGGRFSSAGLAVMLGGRTLDVTGHLWPFERIPRLDVGAISRDFDLASLQPYLATPLPVEGHGEVHAAASGALADPEISLRATLPAGKLGAWPFQDAYLQMRYIHQHLEFLENRLQMLEGFASLKGYLAPENSELQITGENLSLSRLAHFEGMDGRLHFSCNVRGPWRRPDLSGSFWVNGFAWGATFRQDVHGNFEQAAERFQVQALSDDSRLRLAAEGRHGASETRLDRLELRLPSGGHFTGQGAMDADTRGLSGNYSGEGIRFPEDVPFLKRLAPLALGLVSVEGKVGGRLSSPVLEGSLSATEIRLGSAPFQSGQSAFHWKERRWTLNDFRVDDKIVGTWQQKPQEGAWSLALRLNEAPGEALCALIFKRSLLTGAVSGHVKIEKERDVSGEGRLRLRSGALMAWPVEDADAEFSLRPQHLEVSQLTWAGRFEKGALRGSATWPAPVPAKPLGFFRWTADGSLSSTKSGPAWSAPVSIRGEASPPAQWRGWSTVRSGAIRLGDESQPPAEVRLDWTPERFAWADGKWGDAWQSDGVLLFSGSAWNAGLRAHGAALGPWMRWLGVNEKNAVTGAISGEARLSGTLDHPVVTTTAQWEGAAWRAFRFNSDLEARWTRDGLAPVTLRGRLAPGGTFLFRGSLTG